MKKLTDTVLVVDVRSIHERVYAEMRRALAQGHFSLGQSLTIKGLAAAFGTSEMPVREAIKRLVADKMIVQMSNRTFRVPELDWSQFEDILSLRVHLEGLAAQRATAVASVNLVTMLRCRNDEMKAALKADEKKTVLKKNREFHFTIYEASGSNMLIEMIERLWMRSGPYLSGAISEIDGAEMMFRDATEIHEEIIAAIAARDQMKVFSAIERDLTTSAKWYESRSRRPDRDRTSGGQSSSNAIGEPDQAGLPEGLARAELL